MIDKQWTEERHIQTAIALAVANSVERTTGLSVTNTEFSAIESIVATVSGPLEKVRTQIIKDRAHIIEMSKENDQ